AGRLDAALRELEPGDLTARAHAARARLHLLSNMALGLEEFEAGLNDAHDPQLRLRLEALLLEATAYDGALAHHRAALLDQGVRDPDASPVMLAHLAQESAYRCEPKETSERLVQAALDQGLVEAVGPDSGTYHLAALAMRHAELPQVVDRLLVAGEQGVHRTGSIMGRWYMEHARALWHSMFGSLADAEAHARTALTVADDVDMLVVRFSSVVAVADILVARGRPAEARALLDSIHAPKGVQSGMTWPDRLAVTAELHVLDGNLAAAEEELRHAIALLRERGWRAPFKAGAGLRLAAVLAAQGRHEEALATADEEADAARRAGTPGALGAALRARALGLTDPGDRVDQLEEAVQTLRASPMAVERAHALADLGDALRAADKADDAREALRAALETAEERGATTLATRARHALVELGARPRRAAVRGVDALTPSERRVAGLAASGMTNREIAESLFVTRKTVELHLGHAYAKLGIKSRAQLPQELATVPA
ncbi:MAG TPA: LuxR C-terminal-related transcriptional regulator, partial [Solirubrobacteraceae bacterium]|nr:LuxR C-terminal-related transcriptional regulator [Solirubrobacteraceae bacterium]